MDLFRDLAQDRGQARLLVERRDDHRELVSVRLLGPVLPQEVPGGQAVGVVAQQVLQPIGLEERTEQQDVDDDARDDEHADDPPEVPRLEPKDVQEGLDDVGVDRDDGQPRRQAAHDDGVRDPEPAAAPPHRDPGQHQDRDHPTENSQVAERSNGDHVPPQMLPRG